MIDDSSRDVKTLSKEICLCYGNYEFAEEEDEKTEEMKEEEGNDEG
jgi:hypothetical protein